MELTKVDVLSAFSSTPPVLDFVMPGMLSGTVGAIIGPGGAGKSMAALEIAIAVAGGPDLLGLWDTLIPRTGRVVYFAAEDPVPPIQRRLHSLGGSLSPQARAHVDEHLTIYSIIGQPADIMTAQWQEKLLAESRDSRLIILDTLRRLHHLDENSSGDMARLIGALEHVAHKSSCSILYLHHSSKSAAINGLGSEQQATRGSSVLTDNVRWQANMVVLDKKTAAKSKIDEKNRRKYVQFCVSKQNYDAPIPDKWLKREAGGVLVQTSLSAGVQSLFVGRERAAA